MEQTTHPLHACAIEFMARARLACQWHDNMVVLAPGERTLYMDKAAYTAARMLAGQLQGSALLTISCQAPTVPGNPTNTTMKARSWLVEYAGRVYDIEGATHVDQATRDTRERWLLANGGARLSCEPLVSVQPCLEPPHGMTEADATTHALATAFSGPLATVVCPVVLDLNTINMRRASPSRRI